MRRDAHDGKAAALATESGPSVRLARSLTLCKGTGAQPPDDVPQHERTAQAAQEAGPKTLPQYVAITAELRKLTHAPTILAVVPAVKDMQQSLLQYKQSLAQVQGLTAQLCVSLSAGSAEAMLAERIRSLMSDAVAGSDVAAMS